MGKKLAEGWKEGPTPENTWGFGGVVLAEYKDCDGFYFADFKGNYVTTFPDGKDYLNDQIVAYNNTLLLPQPMSAGSTAPQDMNPAEFRQYSINFVDDALGHSWFVRGDTRKFLQSVRSFVTVMPEDQLKVFQSMLPR